MDPTKDLILVKSSFNTNSSELKVNTDSDRFSDNESMKVPSSNIITINQNMTIESLFDENLVDKKLFIELDKIKKSYGEYRQSTDTSRIFSQARKLTNPFENLGFSVFMDRAGVKMANCDAVFDLTDSQTTLRLMRQGGKFIFVTLAEAPGAFVQYIQWRRPTSFGYGMSLATPGEIQWSKKNINMERFSIQNGPDNTGNLYTNTDWLIEDIMEKEGDNVVFVAADGGFDVSKGNKFHLQEHLSNRLIMMEIYGAIGLLRAGGNFCCKVFDTVMPMMRDLIFCCSLLFREVWLFKPISSRPANSERYMICKGFLLKYKIDKLSKDAIDVTDTEVMNIIDKTKIANRIKILTLLKNVNQLYETKDVLQIFDKIPKKFIKWLKQQNNQSFRRQIDVGKKIIEYLSFSEELGPSEEASEKIDIVSYNLSKAFLLWRIPDNKVQDKFFPKARYHGPSHKGQKGRHRKNNYRGRRNR